MIGTDSFSLNGQQGPWLFDLANDPNESYDASRRYPEAVERMAALYAEKSSEIEENPRGWR